MTDYKVTIVIPNYNGKKFLKDCLRSLSKQTMPSKVIVVDNGSDDGALEEIIDDMKVHPGRYPELEFKKLNDNTGFAHAVNVGISMCDTEFVILLNNDTVADEYFTEKLFKSIEKRKRAFSVSAKMLSMKDPELIDDSGDLYCALGWAFSPGRDKNRKKYNKVSKITSACAGAAIYRKSIMDEIGGFDDAHFCYLEDVDVGYRARVYGYSNYFEPSAIVYHAGSGSSGSRYNVFKEELTSANNLYLIYKNMPALQIVINSPLIIAGIVVKQIYFSKKGLGAAYFKGLLNGIKKSADNRDKKIKYKVGHFKNYLLLEIELIINCFRRLVG